VAREHVEVSVGVQDGDVRVDRNGGDQQSTSARPVSPLRRRSR